MAGLLQALGDVGKAVGGVVGDVVSVPGRIIAPIADPDGKNGGYFGQDYHKRDLAKRDGGAIGESAAKAAVVGLLLGGGPAAIGFGAAGALKLN